MGPEMTPRPLLGLASLLLLGACAATPPPVAVETPFGVVRAETEDKAVEVAGLLEDLAPRVQEVLPGTCDRPIDVWVQKILRDGSHGERAEGVKGFTLLSGDFHAKRIHLLEDGELSWYLAHELVHAQLDSTWRTLPGLLEEGLGDVVAEMLNEEHAERIRAHRLFTSSGFFGGVLFHLAYQKADAPEGSTAWIEAPIRIEVLGEAVDTDVHQLLSLSRHSLRKVYREVPEPFYGLAYLVVSRIVERQGLEGLYALCEQADERKLEVVPVDELLAAADLDPREFDPEFLSSLFGEDETRQLLLMQPELFAETVVSYFRANLGDVSPRTLLYRVNPSLRTADGELVRLRTLWPVRRKLVELWRDGSVALR
jgi:hypothetical protein